MVSRVSFLFHFIELIPAHPLNINPTRHDSRSFRLPSSHVLGTLVNTWALAQSYRCGIIIMGIIIIYNTCSARTMTEGFISIDNTI